jgi:monoamine oxidase
LPRAAAALFGFIRPPSQVRAGATDSTLRSHCRAQLGRLFGPEAAAPVDDYLQDWAREPFTATALDQTADGQHAGAATPSAADGAWRGCLTGIASEWSPQFPGYVAGAIEAAGIGVRGLSTLATLR